MLFRVVWVPLLLLRLLLLLHPLAKEIKLHCGFPAACVGCGSYRVCTAPGCLTINVDPQIQRQSRRVTDDSRLMYVLLSEDWGSGLGCGAR